MEPFSINDDQLSGQRKLKERADPVEQQRIGAYRIPSVGCCRMHLSSRDGQAVCSRSSPARSGLKAAYAT
jgi:hypothetical protein